MKIQASKTIVNLAGQWQHSRIDPINDFDLGKTSTNKTSYGDGVKNELEEEMEN